VRKITGRFDVDQLPDTSPGAGQVSVTNPPGIDDYINDFYLFDFPEHLRSLKLRDFYTFTTLPNIGTYNVPPGIVDLMPPIYVDNYQFSWYQDPEQFYRIWPELNFIDHSLAQGTGSKFIFTITLSQTPIQQGTVVIGINPNPTTTPAPQIETFVDSDTPLLLDQPLQETFVNAGILISNLYVGALPPASPGVTPGTGTINYLTGACTLSYINAPPNGSNINAHYHPYVAARPRDIMFYQQQLFLRPIPDDVYSVKLMAYMQPTVAINNLTNSGTFWPPPATLQQTPGIPSQFAGDSVSGSASMSTLPQFQEWWQVIAYGAALKIFVEEGDHEEFQRHKMYFEEQKLLAQRKALKQLANQRIQTQYAQNQGGTPSWPIFPLY